MKFHLIYHPTSPTFSHHQKIHPNFPWLDPRNTCFAEETHHLTLPRTIPTRGLKQEDDWLTTWDGWRIFPIGVLLFFSDYVAMLLLVFSRNIHPKSAVTTSPNSCIWAAKVVTICSQIFGSKPIQTSLSIFTVSETSLVSSKHLFWETWCHSLLQSKGCRELANHRQPLI